MSQSSPEPQLSPCTQCGACCDYSAEWPRFSTEDEAELQLIPQSYVAESLAGMRCEGDRCSALMGRVGVVVACAIYKVRPHVCRACEPGDDACQMARAAHRLPPLPVSHTSDEDDAAERKEQVWPPTTSS